MTNAALHAVVKQKIARRELPQPQPYIHLLVAVLFDHVRKLIMTLAITLAEARTRLCARIYMLPAECTVAEPY